MSQPDLRLRAAEPPQSYDRVSTARIMWTLVSVLLPAAAWGVYLFGPRAAAVISVAVMTTVLSELGAGIVARRRSLSDGSAVLTGLLIGMAMPPGVPLFLPAAASIFAILVVKWSFGGLGANWMNPPLAGWLFVSLSWEQHMGATHAPSLLPDALSGATPLSLARAGESLAAGPMDALARAGYPVSAIDTGATAWLNARLLGPLGIDLPGGYVDLFVGNSAGAIGEGSAALLLLATVVLFALRIISWHIPVAYFGSFAALTLLFGGVPYGQGLLAGDVLFGALTGGLLFSLFFFATDSVTSPATRLGQIVYGVGIGSLVFVFRTFGSSAEAAGLSILLMNVLVPTVDRLTRPRRFGVPRSFREVT